jgi:arsenate reductase
MIAVGRENRTFLEQRAMSRESRLAPFVLFVCTENIARSQMAEAILKNRGGGEYDVASCGLHPGPEVHPLAVEVMQEVGLDISQQTPKAAKDFLGKRPVNYAIVVCETAEPQCPRLWPVPTERIFWPLRNPAAHTGRRHERLQAFRDVRDELTQRIDSWLAEQARRALLFDSHQVVAALAALAQESRLAVFRLLIRAGDTGMAAGAISTALEITPNTLSFHLNQLTTAGLVASRRDGRSIIYRVRMERARGLLDYLVEDCCANHGNPKC